MRVQVEEVTWFEKSTEPKQLGDYHVTLKDGTVVRDQWTRGVLNKASRPYWENNGSNVVAWASLLKGYLTI